MVLECEFDDEVEKQLTILCMSAAELYVPSCCTLFVSTDPCVCPDVSKASTQWSILYMEWAASVVLPILEYS